MARYVWITLAIAALCLALATALASRMVLALEPGAGSGEAAARAVERTLAEAHDLIAASQSSTGAAREVYGRKLTAAGTRLRAEIEVAGDEEISSAALGLPTDLSLAMNADRWPVVERTFTMIGVAAARCAAERAAAEAKDAVRSEARDARLALALCAASLAILALAALGLARVLGAHARERSELGRLLADGAGDEDLAARAARLRGRADRLAQRHDESVISRLTLAEALSSYEAAQDQLHRAQDALGASLTEAREEVERLRISSMLDELTGALKYPYLVHRIRELLGALLESGTPFCLLELDLDNFKDINDTYGHAAGDDALREFAGLLRTSCRERDLVIRKSGDEFFVLAPETALEEALALGERLRQQVNSHMVVSMNAAGDRYEFPLGASIGVLDTTTVDIGALRGIADPDLAVREIISYVDAALYRAKHAGKNCVRGYESGMRVVDLASTETPPDLPRINRLARSRYSHLDTERRTRFDALLEEASELLFPKRKSGK